MPVVDIEQVVQPQRIVERGGGARLDLPCRQTAAVVERQAGAPDLALLPRDHQVALSRGSTIALCGHDPDIRGHGGSALHVLQCLLDIAQVQQIAGAGRHGVGQGHARRLSFCETDRPDAAWHHRQCQRSVLQILWRGQHARRDVAARDDGILDAAHHGIDAGRSEAATDGGVLRGIGGRQRPLEPFRELALQADAIDGEARRLVGGQAHGRRLAFAVQPYVGTDFLLLAQRPLTLLLAQQLLLLAQLILRGGAGRLSRRSSDRNHQTAGQPFLQTRWRTGFPCFHARYLPCLNHPWLHPHPLAGGGSATRSAPIAHGHATVTEHAA